MSRHHPNRSRRRRDRRQPPARRGSTPDPLARPRGLGDAGLRQIHGSILPRRGEDRRRLLNEVGSWLVVGLGVAWAVLGLIWGGPGWALIGFAAGVAAGGAFVEERRMYRR